MKCPSPKCENQISDPEPVSNPKKRRIAEFRACKCGAYVRFSSIEGWDRWYATYWWPAKDAEFGSRKELPGNQEFNDRYYGEGHELVE